MGDPPDPGKLLRGKCCGPLHQVPHHQLVAVRLGVLEVGERIDAKREGNLPGAGGELLDCRQSIGAEGVAVRRLENEEHKEIVTVEIPGWKPGEPVRFPLDLVPESIQLHVTPGECLLAKVNLAAESEDDLCLHGFEYRE